MAIAVAADPIPTLYARYGEALAQARHRTSLLEDSLRELETLSAQMGDYDMTAGGGLGPVGNAAKAAYRTVQEHREDHQRDIFAMP